MSAKGPGSAPKTRTATCCCGTLSVTCTGEQELVALCHCLDCQKRTGGPFGVAAFYRETETSVAGPSTQYSRNGESGEAITFHFCPTCGSTVFWYPRIKSDLVAVAIGAFADPAFPAPNKQVYSHRRHAWTALQINSEPGA